MNNSDFIKIRKFWFLLIIFIVSLAFDSGAIYLLCFSNISLTLHRYIIIGGILFRVLIVSGITSLISHTLSSALSSKHHLHYWTIGIFFIPWIFIFPFRFNYSIAMFEAQANPDYVCSIKWLLFRDKALDVDTDDKIVYQFENQADKLAKLESLKEQKLISKKDYLSIKEEIENSTSN